MEIERKYLLREMPLLTDETARLELAQSYIFRHPVIRIRRQQSEKRTDYILTVKGKGEVARVEYELPLSAEDYEALKEKAEPGEITKTRYLLPLTDGHTVELDAFHGVLEGLWMAEVEFSSMEDMENFGAPGYLGQEVSCDGRFHNAAMTAHPEEALEAARMFGAVTTVADTTNLCSENA